MTETTKSTSLEHLFADPRPQATQVEGEWAIVGQRCRSCAYPTFLPVLTCALCDGELQPDRFGPLGTVVSATIVRVPVPGRIPPYALAYVDLDDGPRILSHTLDTLSALVPHQRVEVVGRSDEGDPVIAPAKLATT